jgi:hypothetical protein
MDDMKFIVHIIANLPPEYDTITDQIENDLERAFDTTDIEDVRERLRGKYNKMKVRWSRFTGTNQARNTEERTLDRTSEKALNVGDKGRCYNCGEYGHKAKDCCKEKNGQKEDVQCFYCHRPGHKIADCIKKKEADVRKEKTNMVTEEAL